MDENKYRSMEELTDEEKERLSPLFLLSPDQRKQLENEFKVASSQFAKIQTQNLSNNLSKFVANISKIGWTIPPELGIAVINELATETDSNALDEYLYNYIVAENYRIKNVMASNILNSTIGDNLKGLFVECDEAFKQKLYKVCALSYLAIIEGVLSSYSDDIQDIRMMKVCQKQIDTYPSDGSIGKKYAWISYNYFIRELYAKSHFDQDEPARVNRHWLLHGHSDYNLSEKDCIRLLNAIRTLSMIVDLDKRN